MIVELKRRREGSADDRGAYAADTDARGLLRELAEDLKQITHKYGFYANPRENPEQFENNSVMPDGVGHPGKLNEFWLTVRQELKAFIGDDITPGYGYGTGENDPNEPDAKLLQYPHQRELARMSEKPRKIDLLVQQLEREIMHDIFKDPRA
jgi:hypothetical protein